MSGASKEALRRAQAKYARGARGKMVRRIGRARKALAVATDAGHIEELTFSLGFYRAELAKIEVVRALNTKEG